MLIPVHKIAEHCNPFDRDDGFPFRGIVIKRKAVEKAIKESRLQASYEAEKRTKRYHIERIAYLVQHPASDAIEVDVGCPCLGFHMGWMVTDGNHRLAAAIYRGDNWIDAEIAGEVEYAEELFEVVFPVEVEQ